MDFNALIHNAALAPSGRNTQPWKFSAGTDTVRIYPDFSRRLPVVDPDDHALYISLGCALENLLIAADRHNLKSDVDYFPVDESQDCLRIRFAGNGRNGSKPLYDAIPLRQTNRNPYNGKDIPDNHLRQIIDANICDTVDLKIFRRDSPEIEPIVEFVKEGNRIQFNDKLFVKELVSWIRFSKRDVKKTRDGLEAKALGFPHIPRWLGTFIMNTFVKPESEAKKCEKSIRSSSLMLLFIARRNDRQNWVDVGRSFERVALTATALGIAHAHVNMPCEVEAVRKKFAEHLGLKKGEQPLLLIRLGYTNELPRSSRRPVEEVIRPTLPETIDKPFLNDFIGRLRNAINSHDPDAVAALCSENVVWNDPAAPQPLFGRNAVRQFHEDMLFRAIPDVRYEVINEPYISLDGRRVAVRARFRGTMKGPLDPPGFSPTGKPIEFETAEFWEFENDRLSSDTVVLNMLGLARQIGAVPPPGSAADRMSLLLQRLNAWRLRGDR